MAHTDDDTDEMHRYNGSARHMTAHAPALH